MSDISIRTFTPADAKAVYDLQIRYAARFPGAAVMPGEMYGGPGFAGGRNVFCAWQGAQLVGYAPLYPQPVESGDATLPHVIWAEIKADPALPDPVLVKDHLWEHVWERAQELKAGWPPRKTELRLDYLSTETPSLEYALSKGFRHYESVYTMTRPLAEAIPDTLPPPGVTVRQWKMPSEAEQQQYVAAQNRCFPGAPWDLASMRYFMQSPMWQVGTTVSAFAGEELIGSALLYWDAGENARTGRSVGTVDQVFVLPAWRGHGIASYLLQQGLYYLFANGLAEAELGVRATNEHALHVYQRLGFRTARQSLLLAREV